MGGDQPDWTELGKIPNGSKKRGPESRVPDWHGDAQKKQAKEERDKRERGELVVAVLSPLALRCESVPVLVAQAVAGRGLLLGGAWMCRGAAVVAVAGIGDETAGFFAEGHLCIGIPVPVSVGIGVERGRRGAVEISVCGIDESVAVVVHTVAYLGGPWADRRIGIVAVRSVIDLPLRVGAALRGGLRIPVSVPICVGVEELDRGCIHAVVRIVQQAVAVVVDAVAELCSPRVYAGIRVVAVLTSNDFITIDVVVSE